MKFGQLAAAIAKKDAVCAAKCGEPIPAGSKYLGVYRINVLLKNSGKTRSWVNRMHFRCVETWCDIQLANRAKAVTEGRTPKRGRPALSSTPEEKRRRVIIQHSLWNAKDRLIVSYLKGDSSRVRYNWVSLAHWLREYSGIGNKTYLLGEHLSKVLYSNDVEFLSELAKIKPVKKVDDTVRYNDPLQIAECIMNYWDPNGEIVIKHHKYPEHRAAIEPEEELDDE